MAAPDDRNAEIWQSDAIVQHWASEAEQRERKRAVPLRLLAELLPFDRDDDFVLLDLGAGTGAAARAVLEHYPSSTAILADFSAQMMAEGRRLLEPLGDRFDYVEFDLAAGAWPRELGGTVDAVVSSMCVHHLPDPRKRALFAEIRDHLEPGGWYLNFDPVRAPDPGVADAWERVGDLRDPAAAQQRANRSPEEQQRWDNHVRHIALLDEQLGYLRDAGFDAVDVYWKELDSAIFGGCRPE